MSGLAPYVVGYDFDEDPDPPSKINPTALDAELAALAAYQNAIKARLDYLLRSDDTLADGILRVRNLHPELAAVIASAGGWQPKVSAACATTANIALTGEQTIDGVLTSASRVLVRAQTDATQNGIYVSAAGAWSRATDADSADELGYAVVTVDGGSVNAGTSWIMTLAASAITLGVTALAWAQLSGLPTVVPIGRGGTGASTAAAARLALGVSAAMDPVVTAATLAAARAALGPWGDALVTPTGSLTARSLATRFAETLNAKDFGAVGDGVTDDTAAIVAGLAAAATARVPLYLPPGTYLTDKITAPANFCGIVGAGRRLVTLKFKRYAYTAASQMISATNTGQPFVLRSFAMDMNDAVFQTAGAYGIRIQDCSDIELSDIAITCRGEYQINLAGITRGRVSDIKMIGGTGCRVGIYAVTGTGNTSDLEIDRCSMTGTHEYAIVFGAACYHSAIRNSYAEGTSGGFAFSIAGSEYCIISGCRSKNSSHEAFQITDAYNCTIIGCHGEWDGSTGIDMGISINGQSGKEARFNKVIGNTLINCFGAAICAANNSQYNLFIGNVSRDCGVRGVAAGSSGSNIAQCCTYTDIAGAQCTNNSFIGNRLVAESGPVTYSYAEFQTGGGGATVNGQFLDSNDLVGATTKYLIVGTATRVSDPGTQSFTPAVSSSGGTLGTASATMTYQRRGAFVRFELVVTITANGTGSGAIVVTLPLAATQGIAHGRADAISGLALQAKASGSGLTITTHANAYPAASGEVLRISGEYQL